MRIISGLLAIVLAAGVATADGVNIMVASACDSSPGQLDAQTRKHHGELARRALASSIEREHFDLAGKRQLDVSVTKWTVVTSGNKTTVTAEIRVVVCDGRARMLSFLRGKATVIAVNTKLDELRRQAIDEAVASLGRSLHSQLDAPRNS